MGSASAAAYSSALICSWQGGEQVSGSRQMDAGSSEAGRQAWMQGPAYAAGGSRSAFRQPELCQRENGRGTRRSVAPTFPARANPATRRAITTSSRRNQLHRGRGRQGHTIG
jgi:hypothetical protein